MTGTPEAFGKRVNLPWTSFDEKYTDIEKMADTVRIKLEQQFAARLEAAKLQHVYGARVRIAIRQWRPDETQNPAIATLKTDLNQKRTANGKKPLGALSRMRKYALLSGSSYDRLMKVLRGEAIMRLEDIAAARKILQIEVTTEPQPNPPTATSRRPRI